MDEDFDPVAKLCPSRDEAVRKQDFVFSIGKIESLWGLSLDHKLLDLTDSHGSIVDQVPARPVVSGLGWPFDPGRRG